MKKIRFNVFETNSSSVHSLILVTPEIYKKYFNGEASLDIEKIELVLEDDIPNKYKKNDELYGERYYNIAREGDYYVSMKKLEVFDKDGNPMIALSINASNE